MSRTGLLLICLMVVTGCRTSALTDPFTNANGRRVPPPPTGSVGVPGAGDAYYSPTVTPGTAAPAPGVAPQGNTAPPVVQPRWQQTGATDSLPQQPAGLASSNANPANAGFRSPNVPGSPVGTGVRTAAAPRANTSSFAMKGMPVNDATQLGVPRTAPQPGLLNDIGDPTRPIYRASISRSTANVNQVARPTTTPPGTSPATWNAAGTTPRTAGSVPFGAAVKQMSFSSPAVPGDGRYHYASDYTQVRGKLDYSASQRRWLVHYLTPDGTPSPGDKYGGTLTITDNGQLDGFKPGDFVELSGRVMADPTGNTYVAERVKRQPVR